MSRRFPPPLFGVEQTERRSDVFVGIVLENDGEIEKATLVDRARDQLRKPDGGGQYSESYVRRIVSTFIQLGVLRQRNNGAVTVWQFARDWQNDEIGFETFLRYAIKRSWVLEGEFPEGIDGLRSMHRILANADEPLSRAELKRTLGTDLDYEFNDEGIRGYPTLLDRLGAVTQVDSGYVAAESVDTWGDRFRNMDLLSAFERWLKQEGPSVEPPSDRVKRDLSKYYLYRESGGHGKHRRLFDTFRRDYLKASAYENDVSEPRILRAEKYVDAENERQELRDSIIEQFPSFTGNDLSGLSTETLERLRDADSSSEAYRIKAAAGAGLSRSDLEQWAGTDRPAYTFSEAFDLYDWQREAATNWFKTETSESKSEKLPESGITRVVTGAGKTVMALEVIRRWLDEHPEGAVTVIVPTKVLMNQWLGEFVEKLGVPADDIGWAGDGHKDGFEDGYRILVSIVNTAIKDDYLRETLDESGQEEHLLIADECHRYTGEAFSNVFEYPRTASLGLSATPLSNPESDERSGGDELLLDELGPIYYDLSYDEGIGRGLIPEFEVNYVGFELTDAERTTYEQFSEKVADAVSDIESRYGNRLYELNGSYAQKLKTISNGMDGPTPAISDFFQFTQQRRQLVADAVGRQAATLALLRQTIEESKKSIVFQEQIDQLERMVAPADSRGRNYRTGEVSDEFGDRQELYDRYPGLKQADKGLEELFFDADYRPVMYHSGHRREAWNDFAIDWFSDDGFANVMLSVRALIEGVDVPSADVGIVRVSSGSVRQRIQTLGRVLRTGTDPSSASELYVLYARDTVDESIFHDYDWDDELSMAEVSHLTWDPDGDWTSDEWDRTALFSDCVRPATADEIPSERTGRSTPDVEDLSRGDTYDGPLEGYRFSVDSSGKPFEKRKTGRRHITNDKAAEMAEFVHSHKGGGSIIVNEAGHAVTFLEKEPVFIGTIDPDSFEYESEGSSITDEPDDDELADML